ncbi:MAG TPA: LPS export ABC transporter periplasmic protein LptC [Roseiarcus sp.]|nr:LPS export ABC transporter periplasmic protein LptC [Roseiarcus sp.]
MGLLGNSMPASVKSAERPAARAARAGHRRVAFSPPSDRERAFARARRRSSRVRFLRKAILVCGFGTVAALVLIGVYNPFSTKLGSLSFSDISIDGTKIEMARPKLAGFRTDGQPYALTAERALQDVKQPTIVELQKVSGEIGATGGETTHVTADTGIYDSVAQHMKLSSNVRIGSARFQVRLRSADIDFKTGVYQSDEPVEVHVGDGTTITGDRATARHNGQELTFEGRVRTTINPPADAAADADAKRTGQ